EGESGGGRGAAGAGGGLGGRRDGDAEEGAPLGRGGAPVLRRARQTGELPGGGERLAGPRAGPRACRLPAVSAGGVGAGPTPTARGRGAGPDRVPAEMANRPRADHAAPGGRGAGPPGGRRRRGG